MNTSSFELLSVLFDRPKKGDIIYFSNPTNDLFSRLNLHSAYSKKFESGIINFKSGTSKELNQFVKLNDYSYKYPTIAKSGNSTNFHMNSSIVSEQYSNQRLKQNTNSSETEPLLALNMTRKIKTAGLIGKEQSESENQTSNVIASVTDLSHVGTSVFADNNTDNTLQGIGIDPDPDPTGDPIPVGDNLIFMIFLACIYAFWKWSALKTHL
ncbi:MAG: hypothetical protein PHS59_11375 [Paludibacter sp.]|nr:hypothetical protein [Paludibacter sp.]